MSIKETVKKIKSGEIKSSDLVKKSYENIDKYDKSINAFLTLTYERAIENASFIDAMAEDGKGEELSPIAGIPMALKDNISVRDVRMTSGSKMLEDYVSPYNATVVDRLKDAVLIGKTNMDSFAFGSSTENSGYFVTKNPWDNSKVAGGSSGGSAASVASSMVMFALGTDTGGSIRQPSGLCGVVGLKPTYGRSSRYGLSAMGSSLDCPGPIAKSVEDAAYILSLVAGVDKKDSTSVDRPLDVYTNFSSIKGKKAGLPKEFFDSKLIEFLNKGTKERVLETVKKLESLGVEIIEVSMPLSIYALPVYYIITPSEISANMSRFDGIRYGHTTNDPKDLMDLYLQSRESFENEVKRRIFVGNYTLSSGYYDAYYNKAMQVRTLIIEEMNKTLDKVDFIIGPTSPSPAFEVGEKIGDPIAMYLEDIYTVTANIAGIPAISIPCGLSDNLPVGFQIMGKQFDEKMILDVAYALEQEIKFNDKYSPNL